MPLQLGGGGHSQRSIFQLILFHHFAPFRIRVFTDRDVDNRVRRILSRPHPHMLILDPTRLLRRNVNSGSSGTAHEGHHRIPLRSVGPLILVQILILALAIVAAMSGPNGGGRERVGYNGSRHGRETSRGLELIVTVVVVGREGRIDVSTCVELRVVVIEDLVSVYI